MCVCNIFSNRFEGLGVKWQDIPDDVRSKLENEFQTKVDKFRRCIDLLRILQSFGSLKYDWTKNQKLRESVLNAFCRNFVVKRVRNSLHNDGNSDKRIGPTPERFSSCVHYFGEAGMNWNELSWEMQDIIIGRSLQYCEAFSALELKNLRTG
jgi:hypothetical protein